MKRFWDKVIKGEGCWEWRGAMGGNGYGVIWFNDRLAKAHRASWVMENGPIPEGMLVCHKCDNRRCVRPDHLFLGTVRDNQMDAAVKGRLGRRLTPEQVREIRRLREEGVYPTALSRQFGVSRSTIKILLNGRTWSHVQ